jgi:hypothetical protein
MSVGILAVDDEADVAGSRPTPQLRQMPLYGLPRRS